MATKKVSKSKSTKLKAKAKAKNSSKKPFGGYAISFAGKTDSVEKIFGKKPIPPSEMTKKLWAYVKSNNLSNK